MKGYEVLVTEAEKGAKAILEFRTKQFEEADILDWPIIKEHFREEEMVACKHTNTTPYINRINRHYHKFFSEEFGNIV